MDAKDISLGKNKIIGQYLDTEDGYSRQQKWLFWTTYMYLYKLSGLTWNISDISKKKKPDLANIHNFLGDNIQYGIYLCLRLKQNETENPHGIALNSRISLVLFLLATMIRIWL